LLKSKPHESHLSPLSWRAPALALLIAAAGCSAKLESDGLDSTGMVPTAEKPANSPGLAPAPEPDATDAGLTDADGFTPPADNDPGFPDAGAAPAPPPGAPEQPPPSEVTGAPICGEPPYQPFRLSAHDIMAPAAKNDLADVVVTLKHCPGKSFKLPPGAGTLLVTAGVDTWIRFAAPGYLPWLEGEITVPRRGAPIAIEATMVAATIAPTLLPSWKVESAVIYVEVRRGRAVESEPCRSPAGVRLSVKGHPEALVRYRGKGANASFELPMLATSEEGVAMITNLLPPVLATVEIVAEKPDCTYEPAYGDANSAMLFPILRTPLEAGAITHQVFNPAR
jgi:hypothetical protein